MGQLDRTGEQDGNWGRAEPFGDPVDDVKRGVIARHVDGRVVGCLAPKPITGPVTGSLPGGPCSAGTAVTVTGPTVSGCIPRLQTHRVPAKSLCCDDSRQHGPGLRQDVAAGGVEVVGVVIV